ncbi:type IV pilin N-terminal domain-containing protein [Haloarchaeobius sp. TZWSO28]|uniref:type IV pilin N-terminal domain-containing protein n=1 Tax=Haloarchaeobius sp. TZWSO28 TaxID=3446119 RepID=UPI003EBE9EA7
MTDEAEFERAPQEKRTWVIALVFVMLAASVLGVGGAYIFGGQEPLNPPDTEFAFERTGETELRITHDGGEALTAGDLQIVVDGSRTTWDATDFGIEPDDKVGEGDSTTISGVQSGQTVQLIYERGSRSYIVGEYTLAGNETSA